MALLDLQDDELEALQSIYPGLVSVEQRDAAEGTHAIALTVPVGLQGPTPVQLRSTRMQGASTPSLNVSHLPSLLARITLPSEYPTHAPPRLDSLRAPLPLEQAGSWLSRRVLAKVGARLQEHWEEENELGGEGTGVIWRWWDWVSSATFLDELGILSDGTLTLSTPHFLPPSSFHLALKSHNASVLRTDFEDTAFPCGICFENPKGSKCVQLPSCGCVFCHACLSSFWKLAIEEGSLQNVACPSVSCVKGRGGSVNHAAGANSEERSDGITPETVESVVGKDLVHRWRLLSEKRLVDTDPSYTFCPRERCQAPVPPSARADTQGSLSAPLSSPKVLRIETKRKPSDAVATSLKREPASDASISASRWDNFRSCPRCTYVFCVQCRGTWHGAHTPCSIRDAEAAVKEYLEEDDEGKAAIELRLGPRNAEALRALVRDYEREQLVLSWISENTTPCPCCSVPIQKSEGCNHMTCDRCMTHFCYRCGKTISARNPYDHFNTPATPCYKKLFDYDPNGQDFWIPLDALHFD